MAGGKIGGKFCEKIGGKIDGKIRRRLKTTSMDSQNKCQEFRRCYF